MRWITLCAIAAALAAPAPAAPAADAGRGEALFVGSRRLANGGAPCLACHGLAGHGLGFSASFGPDLSAASQTYDEASLAGMLTDIPFPTMEPIYRAHALTPDERADVATFLLSVHPGPLAGDPRLALAGEAGAGVLVVLGTLWLLKRRRMPPVGEALRARARGGRP